MPTSLPQDARNPSYRTAHLRTFPALAAMVGVADRFIASYGSAKQFTERMGRVVRRAFDEVIDMPHTGRYKVAQLAKTEKTYIGTKIEHLLMHEFELIDGIKLDIQFEGHEIDIKNTIGGFSWAIPDEAVDEICLIIAGDDEENKFSAGFFRAAEAHLTPARNKDGKRGISAAGRQTVYWIAKDASMPENFMVSLPDPIRSGILSAKGGSAKLRELFRKVTLRPIHRDVVEGVAQQKDPLKRVRANGGARDQLIKEGILVLSGKYDHELLVALGFPAIANNQFLSIHRREVEARLGSAKAHELFAKA